MTTDALGVIATNVALLSRPEIGEVREGNVGGRGGSSTMPHKRNPVLAVLVRSASLQAPQLLAQLHLAAAQAVDERPDGAWHSEWSALARLLQLTAVAASQTAELVSALEVDGAAMKARVDAVAEQLLPQSGKATDPQDYLGAATALVDSVLARVPREANSDA
jgi:adenylosuccinate lyase